MSAPITVIAGQTLYAALEAERDARVPQSQSREGCFDSTALCALHSAQANRGILGATLVRSVYGWSVRYDSGLQNFGILASARGGSLDGTYAAAEQFARGWVERDPDHRYAWVWTSETRVNEVRP